MVLNPGNNKKTINRILDVLEIQIRNGVAEGINAYTEVLLWEAQEKTPIDTGLLRSENNQQRAIDYGKDIKGSVYNKVNYAADQHENLAYNHPKGGQAKFFSEPGYRRKKDLINFVKNSVNSAVKTPKNFLASRI